MIHCQTKLQAVELRKALEHRLRACGLELYPEKTKIVYCGRKERNKSYPLVTFDFLGYTFKRRKARTKQGLNFTSFLPAISNTAKVSIRNKMRTWQLHRRGGSDLKTLASYTNPILRGWINYYGAFYKTELHSVLRHMNRLLVRRAMRKYKRLRNRKVRAIKWISEISQRNPYLFEHWRIGVKLSVG